MRKILLVLSEWGYWGEELIGPLEVFDEKGYELIFCTPTGRRPRALPPSMSPDFVDPAARAIGDVGGDGREGPRDRQSEQSAPRQSHRPVRLVSAAALLERRR